MSGKSKKRKPRTLEQKAKHAKYMKEYSRKNKEKLNKQNRERLLKRKKEDPVEHERRLKKHREVNQKYHDNNKDEINTRKKAKNWNFTPEKAKIRRDKYQAKNPERISIASARKRAEKGGMHFDLTVEWFNEEYKKGCATTGLQLEPNGSKSPWTVNVDRIIPKLGYVQSNCRLVCSIYNTAKWQWTDSDVLQMAVALLNNLEE